MPPKNTRTDDDLLLRKVLRWTALIVSIFWVALTFYSEVLEADPNRYSARSPEAEARMNACAGDYHMRYQCKDAAIIAENQRGFMVWIGKLCVVLGPPILLAMLLNYAYPSEETIRQRQAEALRKRRIR